MDKTTEYEQLGLQLSADVRQSADNLAMLRDELIPLLQEELNDAKLSGLHQTTDTEILRKYIKISRDIRDFIFKNIDTHVLTIERLADHILCRRQYLAQNKAKPKAEPVLAPPASIFEKLQQATKGMSLEEIEVYMKKLKGE